MPWPARYASASSLSSRQIAESTNAGSHHPDGPRPDVAGPLPAVRGPRNRVFGFARFRLGDSAWACGPCTTPARRGHRRTRWTACDRRRLDHPPLPPRRSPRSTSNSLESGGRCLRGPSRLGAGRTVDRHPHFRARTGVAAISPFRGADSVTRVRVAATVTPARSCRTHRRR